MAAKTVEETIRHGRNGAMPAWKDRLGEEKVHLLFAAYVYSLSHGGAAALNFIRTYALRKSLISTINLSE